MSSLTAAVSALALLAGTAHAAVIAVATSADSTLELHDELGVCVEPARHALYIQGHVRVPGCWVPGQGSVRIVFMDGDYLSLPMIVFRKPTLL